MPRRLRPGSPYCVRCRLRAKVCVCGDAPQLATSTRLVLIMHAGEWGRSNNTGHLTRLALRDVEIRIHGRRDQALSSQDIDTTSRSTLVLFPGRGARPLTPAYLAELPRPLTLMVPDGNWNQAKNMMRRLPMLGQAIPVCLEAPEPGLPGLRCNVREGHRSTFEAIAQALGALEGDEIEDRMLAFLRYVLRRKRATI